MRLHLNFIPVKTAYETRANVMGSLEGGAAAASRTDRGHFLCPTQADVVRHRRT